jgi:ATP-binding cassette subfamily F protein 3
MRSKDVLKEAIRDFDGTVIVVSHDREFLDGLVTKVYEFGGGAVKEHLGGIYDFLQKKKLESLDELGKASKPSLAASAKANASTGGETSSAAGAAGGNAAAGAALSYEEQKERAKKVRKAEKAVADCEAEIERLETEVAALEAKMATPEGAADLSLYEQHGQLKKQLDGVVEQWEAASMELEELSK